MLASPRPSRQASSNNQTDKPTIKPPVNQTIKSFTPPPCPTSKQAGKRKFVGESMKSIVEDGWIKGQSNNQSNNQTKKDLDSLELSNNLIKQSINLSSLVPITPRSRSSPHSLQFFDQPATFTINTPSNNQSNNHSNNQSNGQSFNQTAEFDGSNKKRRTSPSPPPPTPNQSTPSSPMNLRNGMSNNLSSSQSVNYLNSQTIQSNNQSNNQPRLFVEPCTPRVSLSANASPSLHIRRLTISSAASTPTNRANSSNNQWNSQLFNHAFHQSTHASTIQPDRLTVTNHVDDTDIAIETESHSFGKFNQSISVSDDSDDELPVEPKPIRPRGLYMNCSNVDAPTDEYGNVMTVRLIDRSEAASIPKIESDPESLNQSINQSINVSQRKGARRQQQDAWCVASNDQTSSPLNKQTTTRPTFFAVLDGHGREGRAIANQASHKLPHYFFEKLNQSRDQVDNQVIDHAMEHAFESTHDWLHRSGYDQGGACVVASYLTVDQSNNQSSKQSSNKTQLHLGWTGDCAAWLVQHRKPSTDQSISDSIRVVSLASVHTLDNPAESARIKQWEAKQRQNNQALSHSAKQSLSQSHNPSSNQALSPSTRNLINRLNQQSVTHSTIGSIMESPTEANQSSQSINQTINQTSNHFAGCIAPTRSRVMSATGGELAVTRALGDRDYPSVSCVPETAHIVVNQLNDEWEDGWLVLSSDGVSNALNEQSINHFFQSTYDWNSSDVSEALIAIVTKQTTKLSVSQTNSELINQLAKQIYEINQTIPQSGGKRKKYKGDNCTVLAVKLTDYLKSLSNDRWNNRPIEQPVQQSFNPIKKGLSLFAAADEVEEEVADIIVIEQSVTQSITETSSRSDNQVTIKRSFNLSVALDEDQETDDDDDVMIDSAISLPVHQSINRSLSLFADDQEEEEEEEEEESTISIIEEDDQTIDHSSNQTPSPRRRLLESSPSTGGSLTILTDDQDDQPIKQSNKFPRLHLPEPSVLRQTWNPPSAPKKTLMFQFWPTEVQNSDDDEDTIQLCD